MLAGGEGELGRRAEEVRTTAVAAHAGGHVRVGCAEETEGRGDVRFGRREHFGRPCVLVRLPVAAELHEHLAGPDLIPVGERRGLDRGRGALRGLEARRRGAVIARVGAGVAGSGDRDGHRRKRRAEACRQFGGRDRSVVDGDFVEPAGEAIVGVAAQRGAQPNRVAIVDGGFLGGAAHIPGTGDLLAVDEAAHARRIPEDVAHRHVVPASIVHESALGRPTMPAVVALVAGRRRRREKEARAGRAVHLAQPQGPVLVGRTRLRAALADQVDVGALPQPVELHPGFDGDGLAGAEDQSLGGGTVG